mmetsp:Transcript_121219/g.354328  ORF Transcript_121219/g.354328 Transcript_121219/m.354328 type:complete len:203 (+) Transcript_121219:712-1320(+)
MTGVSQIWCGVPLSPACAPRPRPPCAPWFFGTHCGSTSRRRFTLQVPISRSWARLTCITPRFTSLFVRSHSCTPGPRTSAPLAGKVRVSPKRQGEELGGEGLSLSPSSLLLSRLKSANSVAFLASPRTTSKRGLSRFSKPGSASPGIEAETTWTYSRNFSPSSTARENWGKVMSASLLAAMTPPMKAVPAWSMAACSPLAAN